MSRDNQTCPAVAVIGCGYWGKNLVRNFSELGALAAVCDSNSDTARYYAERHGVPVDSLESILASPAIEGVAIATPAEMHAHLVKEALAAGKHVFVEKPVALKTEEAIALEELADRKRRLLMVGHVLQYHPAFIKLKELAAGGELGRIRHIDSRRLMQGNIRREPNILWGLACHDISMILSLLGSNPVTVSAIGSRYQHDGNADVMITHLSFPGGENAHVFVSWLHPYKEQEMVVVGDACMAVFDDTRDWDRKLLLYPGHDQEAGMPVAKQAAGQPVHLEAAEPLREEARHFLDCIRGRQACRTDASEGIRVLRLLEASEHAMRSRASVHLDPDPQTTAEADGDEIRFIDLARQQSRIRQRIEARFRSILDHNQYKLGQEVDELDQRLCEFTAARHCVTCANGTDALILALLAVDLRPGDAVFVPAFSFVAPAETVALLGATPVFVDVDPDFYHMDPATLAAAIEGAAAQNLKPKAIIPVDLFGQPADYGHLNRLAQSANMTVIADAAQSLGARLDGAAVGTLAPITATSFYPSKPLGAYGDGGAVFIENADVAERIRSLRSHGKGRDDFDHVRIGLNSRLSSFQAAVLLEKLALFPEEIRLRNEVAARYTALLGDYADTPRIRDNAEPVWAQYILKVNNRLSCLDRLRQAGVPTAVYYPAPLHRLPAYRHYPHYPAGRGVADNLSETVFSIPMHPYLAAGTIEHIARIVRDAVNEDIGRVGDN